MRWHHRAEQIHIAVREDTTSHSFLTLINDTSIKRSSFSLFAMKPKSNTASCVTLVLGRAKGRSTPRWVGLKSMLQQCSTESRTLLQVCEGGFEGERNRMLSDQSDHNGVAFLNPLLCTVRLKFVTDLFRQSSWRKFSRKLCVLKSGLSLTWFAINWKYIVVELNWNRLQSKITPFWIVNSCISSNGVKNAIAYRNGQVEKLGIWTARV